MCRTIKTVIMSPLVTVFSLETLLLPTKGSIPVTIAFFNSSF